MNKERPSRADFHVHIDGADTEAARRIILDAKERNVGSIALLERNTVTQTMIDAVEYANEIGIRAYTGIEIDGSIDNKKVGFVALGFEPNSPIIQEWLTPDAKIIGPQGTCLDMYRLFFGARINAAKLTP